MGAHTCNFMSCHQVGLFEDEDDCEHEYEYEYEYEYE
jgi:hypothetical protein